MGWSWGHQMSTPVARFCWARKDPVVTSTSFLLCTDLYSAILIMAEFNCRQNKPLWRDCFSVESTSEARCEGPVWPIITSMWVQMCVIMPGWPSACTQMSARLYHLFRRLPSLQHFKVFKNPKRHFCGPAWSNTPLTLSRKILLVCNLAQRASS